MRRRIVSLLLLAALVASLMVMPVSALASSKKARNMTTNARVNLRDPDDYTHIIGTVKKGKTVYFTGKTKKNFYLVTTSSGKTGYVFKMYLDEANSVSKSSVYKVKKYSVLRKKASTSSKGVEGLEAGRYLQVKSVSNGWAYVETSTGKKGYIQTENLTK